jgi:hypothetical protein
LIDQLQSQALATWDEIHPNKAKPPTLDYLIQSRDYIIVFWFEPGVKSKDPVLISKIPRTQNFNPLAKRSIKLVDRLIANLSPPISETLPTRVIAGRVNDLTHIVMGIMPGEPMTMPADNFLGRRTAEVQISAFLDWLIEFQSQAAIGNKDFAWEEFIRGQQEVSGLEFLNADPYQGISQALISRLPPTSIPFTFGYGDAHHSNLLMEQNRISGVIDWIGVEEEGWFYTDWYYFLFFYAFEFFKKNSKTSIDALHRLAIDTILGVGDHWLTRLLQDQTQQYLENNSFDPQLNPEIFLTFLYDLHLPHGKGQLLKYAYSIYGAKYLGQDLTTGKQGFPK